MRTPIVLTCGSVLLSACASVTSDYYADICVTAERNGRLDVAEKACYRALTDVDWGNLGPELKSQRLYNLGRIKRLLSKASEAEDLFKQSLSIEEKLSGPTDPKIGRRLVELSLVLAAQDKWAEGAQYLERAIPISDQFVGQGRSFAALVFSEYGKHFRKTDQPQLAERFESKSAALK